MAIGTKGPGIEGASQSGIHQDRKTSKLAIASLALGILWFGRIGSVLAIVLGTIVLGQIRRRDESGSGMARLGLSSVGWNLLSHSPGVGLLGIAKVGPRDG